MSKHLKRLAAPPSWSIARRVNVYTTKPRPGPHPVRRALPLGVVVRDHLKLARNGREAQLAIGRGDVLVDGRPAKDPKFPVGFMDVVSVPSLKSSWRVVIDHKARLLLSPIEEKEAAWKLVQIRDKTTIKGGRTQLNMHDGRNLLVKKDDYSTGDVLRLEVPAQKIVGHFPLDAGSQVLVTGGRHAGEVAPVLRLETTRSHKPNLVHLDAGGDATFTTIRPYAFPVGDRANLPGTEVSKVV